MPIILDYLNTQDDYKVMVLPDHPTPISTRTHASDPVPYLIYRKGKELDSGVASINEKQHPRPVILLIPASTLWVISQRLTKGEDK